MTRRPAPAEILFVLHTPKDPLSAVFREVSRRAEMLTDAGHTVEIVAPSDVPRLSRLRPRWLPFLFAPAVAWRLLVRPPRLVVFHSHTAWAFALLRRRSRRARGVRMVVQFHGLEPLHHRALSAEHAARGEPFRRRFRFVAERVMPLLLATGCRRADAVWVLNREEAEHVIARRWAPAERVTVVPNSVDDEAFFELPVAGGEPGTLLFLGQWLAGKGTRQLVRAFAALAAEEGALVLECAGVRRPAPEVGADFPAAVRPRVRVVPTLDRAELREALRRAEIFVFPSLAEGSSVALLEAMAAGRPIVATTVGAAPDLLVDGWDALLVPPDDPRALAEAVRRLHADPQLRERLGRGARRVAEAFRWRNLRTSELRRFEHLLGRGAPG